MKKELNISIEKRRRLVGLRPCPQAALSGLPDLKRWVCETLVHGRCDFSSVALLMFFVTKLENFDEEHSGASRYLIVSSIGGKGQSAGFAYPEKRNRKVLRSFASLGRALKFVGYQRDCRRSIRLQDGEHIRCARTKKFRSLRKFTNERNSFLHFCDRRGCFVRDLFHQPRISAHSTGSDSIYCEYFSCCRWIYMQVFWQFYNPFRQFTSLIYRLFVGFGIKCHPQSDSGRDRYNRYPNNLPTLYHGGSFPNFAR